MKIIENIPLGLYSFNLGASARTDMLTFKELDKCEKYLQELYPEGIPAEKLNELFHLSFDETFSELLGVTDDELVERRHYKNKVLNDNITNKITNKR